MIYPKNTAQSENLAILSAVPRWAVYIFVGLILFMMPLYIDIELKHVFNTAKEILFGRLLMAGMIGWVLVQVFGGAILIPRSKAFYFYATTIAFMFISLLWSISPDLSLREISPQVGCFLLFLITLTVVRSETVIQRLISITILSAFLVTLYGMFQYYDLDDQYFQIQNRPVVMETLIGEIAVPAGESAMSTILPFAGANRFFQGILLPQKPEEHFKIYAFMGHRNYFSGYLVLIIPLILIRLLIKLRTIMGSLVAITGGGNVHDSGLVNRSKLIWDLLISSFYSVSLVLMTNAVLLTQTRGALLGMVVSLCFLVLCSLLLSNQSQKERLLYSVGGSVGLVIAVLAFMFITGDKSLFNYAIIISGVSFLCLLVFFRHLISPVLIAVTACIMLLGSYKVITAPERSETIRSYRSTLFRITQTSDWKGSAHQRTLIYSTTLRIITDDLLSLMIGKGIGTFGIHYMVYQVKLFLDTEVSGKFLWDTNKSIYAHNEYIHWMSEIGLVGLALMMLFWHFYIRRVLLGLRRLHATSYAKNPLLVLTVLGLLAGTIGTLVHCVVTFDLHLMYSMVTFYCWAAFALVLSGVRLQRVPLVSMVWRMGLVVGGLLIALLVWQQLSNVYYRDKFWREAFYQFSMKQWKNAFDLYQKALTHDSSLGELLFDFGRALMDSNDNPRILKENIDEYNVKTIKRNLNLNTMYRRPHALNEGEAVGENEDLTDQNLTNNFIAVSSFLEATHNFTDPANFHNIALCFYKESQRDTLDAKTREILAKKSEDYYKAAIDLNPIYAQSLSNLGYLKATRGEDDEALSMLERAVRLKDGQTPTSFLGLAIVYQRKGLSDKALEMFQKLKDLNPANPEPLIRIGTLYYQLGNKIEAEKALLQASELSTNKQQKYALVQQALQVKIPRLQEVVRSDPKNKEAFMDLAFAFVQYGTLPVQIPKKETYLEQGVQALKNLIAQNPNNVDIRLKLSQAYEEMGDLSNLRSAYENVLRVMGPVDPRRNSILRKLELFDR